MFIRNILKNYALVPHLVQNFALGRNTVPQAEHTFPLDTDVCLGINAGSGDGNVPTSPKASLAETIPGGPPTGFWAVPDLGGIPPGIPPAIIPGCPMPGINPGD